MTRSISSEFCTYQYLDSTITMSVCCQVGEEQGVIPVSL